MERTTVGVIGCGFFAQNHLHAWTDLRSKGVEIVAVCDVDEAKARATADKFGVKHWYRDAEAMLREHNGAWDAGDIGNRLRQKGDELSALRGKTIFGERLNINRALG
jgi:predicted dehydrogenase